MDGPLTRVVGVDIGGSTTRARLAVDGATVADARGPSASLTAAGRARASEALRDVIGRLIAPGDPPPDAVCAGAAGAGSELIKAALEQLLADLTGAVRVEVVEDMRVILPAAGHVAGLAVICGTGSSAYATDGRSGARGGGWGYLLGDEGGGYRLVCAALRTLLARRDAGEDPGPLAPALLGDEPLDTVWSSLYADPRPELWAARAPAVIAAPDPAVDELLGAGAREIARIARRAGERIELDPSAPVVVAGGLMAEPRAAGATTAALRAEMPERPVQLLDEPPVAGAVALAAALAA